jgi:four helix bundle protein
MKEKRKYDLENRLVEFAVQVLELAEKLPSSYAPAHLAKQIVRSGTAPALLYGEAQGAESPADFVHKMRIALKELRETSICLKIICKKPYLNIHDTVKVVQENRELIAIFTKSIDTANRNRKK